MGANSLEGLLVGNPVVKFTESKSIVKCLWNSFNVNGLILGQRSLNASGRAYIFEAERNLVLEIIYNPNRKSGLSSLFGKSHKIDEISGVIYEVHPHVIAELEKLHKPMVDRKQYQLNLETDVVRMLSRAEGIWN